MIIACTGGDSELLQSIHPFYNNFYRPFNSVSLPEPEKSFHFSQQLMILPCPPLYLSHFQALSSACYNLLICFLSISSEPTIVRIWLRFITVLHLHHFANVSIEFHLQFSWLFDTVKFLLAFSFKILNSIVSPASFGSSLTSTLGGVGLIATPCVNSAA